MSVTFMILWACCSVVLALILTAPMRSANKRSEYYRKLEQDRQKEEP